MIPHTLDSTLEEGQFCYELAKKMYPICRSITGPGVRESLARIAEHLPDLALHDVPSGYQAFDWTVPDEWIMRDGFVEDESGKKIIDFKKHNLHVLGYSEPVDQWMSLEELDKHLYSLPELPDAIPYVTSYYERHWGFCLTHHQREKLRAGKYRAFIDSEFIKGKLNYADLVLPGETKEEIFLSTYICHPSVVNNELSGPVVLTAVARWLKTLKKRKYTYRFVFAPETIGSIVYLSQHLPHLKSHMVAGFNLTCIGDERAYSYIPSRAGNTLADQVALHALTKMDPHFKRYSWLDRGSDERQYCAPRVDLPVATLMRTKFLEYPEYHTSLDNFDVVTPRGLQGGFDLIRTAIEALEMNVFPKVTAIREPQLSKRASLPAADSLGANTRPKVMVMCEPQLSKRGLYPSLNTRDSSLTVATMMNMISYCDGEHTFLEIAEKIGEPITKLIEEANKLIAAGLLEVK